MPTAVYPNKKEDQIYTQSYSFILIQTNTSHLKIC